MQGRQGKAYGRQGKAVTRIKNNICNYFCHSLHYTGKAISLHGQLLVPHRFSRVHDGLQIEFIDSFWSVADVCLQRNVRISFVVISSKYFVVLSSCFGSPVALERSV